MGSAVATREAPAFTAWSPLQAGVRTRSRVWTRSLLWFSGLASLAIVLQVVAGAYGTELGNSSDESAHFLNGLLVRNYLWHGVTTNPITFAENYYVHYPKIAPLVWPPLFHVVLGLLLLPGWMPQPAALVFIGLIAAWTAFRLSRMVSAFESPLVALTAGAMFLLVPSITDLTGAVMVDIALAALALESAWWLSRYTISRQVRHGVAFGVCATGCCLIKGNGVATTLLPVLLMLTMGRAHLLRARGLHLSAALVALVAGPFVYISYRVCASMGDFGPVDVAGTVRRLETITTLLWQQLTPAPFILAIVGASVTIRRAWRAPRSDEATIPTALVALTLATALFHALLPIQFFGVRYVAMTVAPMIGLVPVGAAFLAGATGRSTDRRSGATAAILIVAVVAFMAARPNATERRPLGVRAAVQALGVDRLAGERILIVSDEMGEGAFVSELAIDDVEPAPTAIRASKLLIDADWLNNDLRLLFDTPEKTLEELKNLHVRYIVFDDSVQAQRMPYWSHVKAVIDNAGNQLALGYRGQSLVDGPTRAISVYTVTEQTPGQRKKLRVSLQHTIGRTLEY